jgi:hypothetical protein
MNFKLTKQSREREMLFGRNVLITEKEYLPVQERSPDLGKLSGRNFRA